MQISDDWQPSASLTHLQQRALLLSKIRNFFTQRGYLEVETPIMAQCGSTDVYLANIQAFFREQTYYLQTSPEYHMKRLLAAGSGPIFQLARVFRDDELGRWHNPEFTLLEWYQLEIDHYQLMQEVDALLQHILTCPPLEIRTYRQVFQDHCHCDPITASLETLQAAVQRHGLEGVLPRDETDRDQFLFLMMSHVVEPGLAKCLNPVAVHGFPISQAALAQVTGDVASRFEIYYQGLELANGFHELTDAEAQRKRFEQDNEQREAKGFAPSRIDERFLTALERGLPPCSGVALGVDRLLAIAMRTNSIAQVMAFDVGRA